MAMKSITMLGIVLLLLLVPNVSAITTGDLCVNGNIRKNTTDITSGFENIQETPCENGCLQIDAGKWICATNAFYVPIEIFIMFEGMAFVLFFFSLFMIYGKDRSGNQIILPLLSLFMFSTMAAMSFSIEGTSFLSGAIINMMFAIFSMLFVMMGAFDAFPNK